MLVPLVVEVVRDDEAEVLEPSSREALRNVLRGHVRCRDAVDAEAGRGGMSQEPGAHRGGDDGSFPSPGRAGDEQSGPLVELAVEWGGNGVVGEALGRVEPVGRWRRLEERDRSGVRWPRSSGALAT